MRRAIDLARKKRWRNFASTRSSPMTDGWKQKTTAKIPVNISEYKRKQLHVPGAEEMSKYTPMIIQHQIASFFILSSCDLSSNTTTKHIHTCRYRRCPVVSSITAC